ncbi:MAG: T9SS type A sorting domain-containing protein, partial [Ignavibacteria bacterium]|nr:T9SS type A sorting domain-containing protein [Ignavibacteria bacterium]
ITFSNLPEEVTIKIYSLSGILVKTLTENDKESFASPFLNWNLRNEDGKKVADGVYIAHIKTKFGEKVLKFSVVKMK